ncbi:cysteine-rich repeat secretory protein 1-like [Diospyros lotus]|uniref:cysteine-rich repeat secretory protein 1-like n=1 Tax=Diospyros lotus TaxID=55363 RepID=UPI0022541F5C|nr:cysteine-rich repeat secretory protein 1-like [Diospyros lotus]
MGFNSGNRLLLLLLSISLTISFTITSGDRRYFIRNFCSESGNYTLDSPFRKNLKLALSNLPSNTSSNYGYYNVSVGQASDKVYAISYCRGDVSPDTCKSCVDDSIQEIFQCCPNQIEALGFYDYCLLRYSNRSMFGLLETLPSFNWTSKIVVNITYQFKQEPENLLNLLREDIDSGRNFTVSYWESLEDFFICTGISELA